MSAVILAEGSGEGKVFLEKFPVDADIPLAE